MWCGGLRTAGKQRVAGLRGGEAEELAAGVEDVELSPEDLEEIATARKADFELLLLQLIEHMSV